MILRNGVINKKATMFPGVVVCAIYILNELNAVNELYGNKLGLIRIELNSLITIKST